MIVRDGDGSFVNGKFWPSYQMTEVYQRMPSDKDEDSPAKCRERRRWRIRMKRCSTVSDTCSVPPASPSEKENRTESPDCVAESKRMKRRSAVSATCSVPPGSPSEKENRTESPDCVAESKGIRMMSETKDVPAYAALASSSVSSGDSTEQVVSQAPAAEAQAVEPVFGLMSVTGRAREMEDAISVQTSLCRPHINRWRPVVHFFAVYDGHGGPNVASLCKEKMHVFVEEELMRVSCTAGSEGAGGVDSPSARQEREPGTQNTADWEERWRRAITRSFQRMDEVAVSTCACGSVGGDCGCQSVEVALSGSTAVVAVLTSEHIIVANCGDSRAVLCRAGRAVPLSRDHKPDRPDELARIEATGGKVIFVNGARVEGILAMSRAIGDKYLKPVVTAEPEITFTKREPQDECLILASDGLWDVLSSDLACEIASECLREGNREAVAQIENEGAGILYPSRSVLAAALLTRLALGRKSSDNISVIVVDLKRS